MFFESIKDLSLVQLMAPLLPSQSLFFVYLGATLILSMGVYLYFTHREARARPDGIANGMFWYIFDPEVWWHKSARQDYVFFVLNALIYSGIVAQFLVSGAVFYAIFETGLGWIFGARDAPVFAPSPVSAVGFTLAVVIAIDFAIFLTHYIQHKIAALWHFHSVHHSAEVLTIITVYRQHPVDLFITGSLIVALTQLAHATFAYLTLAEPSEITVMNVNVVIFVFFIIGYNLRHSHIWLSYPPWMSYILISPAQHQTHHSVDAKHFDRNFGFIFAVWDWLFGTLYVPRGYEKLEFGLSREEPNPFHSMSDIYLKPFRLSWGEIASAFSRPSDRNEDETVASKPVDDKRA